MDDAAKGGKEKARKYEAGNVSCTHVDGEENFRKSHQLRVVVVYTPSHLHHLQDFRPINTRSKAIFFFWWYNVYILIYI